MRCLILAAGQGTRIRSLGSTKPLIPVLGIPLIERVIRAASNAGADDFCVVTGYNGNEVRGFLDQLASRMGLRLTHVVNEEWEKGNGVRLTLEKTTAGKRPLLGPSGEDL